MNRVAARRSAVMLKFQSVQGLIAAAVGLGSFFLIGVILSGFPGIENFVFEKLMYFPLRGTFTPAARFWAEALALLAGLIPMMIISVIVGGMIIFVFRWLGIKPIWKIISRFIGWLLVFNVIAYITVYLLSITASPGLPSLWVQVLQAYLPILAFALPYPAAWLIATRKK